VRQALDLLAAGRLEESLEVLRAVLHEDPDNVRAQAAVQEVRRAGRARGAPAAAPPAPAPPAPAPPPPAEPAVRAPAAPPPPPGRAPASRPASTRSGPLPVPRLEEVPAAVLLRRRRTTPLVVVVGSAVAAFAILLALSGQRTARPAAATPLPAASPGVPTPPPPSVAASATAPGPLSALAPDVRQAVEATLAAYGRALETRDAYLLAQARPDLSTQARQDLLARFEGALNVAVDLRVIDASATEATAQVSVLRTDVIIGGRGGIPGPVEEVLRFDRRSGSWQMTAR
jgi:hypothetical protein